MTERQIFQTILAHQAPPRFPKVGYMQLSFVPGEHSMDPNGGYDWFGVHWTRNPDGTQVVTPGPKRLESFTQWREAMPAGVNEEEMKHFGALAQADYDRVNKVQVVGIQSGHFERMENLVGMEEALCAFYECPEEIDAFFDAMTEFKIEMFRQIKKYYNPDVVSPHDDWGTNLNMFFSPEMWRKHVKRHIKRMVDAAHELGMLYEQHTCGYITPIFGDLVECGVDMAEIQAINDLKYIKENYGSQIVLRGCFNGQILSAPDVTEEEFRETVRKTLNICGEGGNFLVQRVWGVNDPKLVAALLEEFDQYSLTHYGSC